MPESTLARIDNGALFYGAETWDGDIGDIRFSSYDLKAFGKVFLLKCIKRVGHRLLLYEVLKSMGGW